MSNNKQSSVEYCAFEVSRLHIHLENRTISLSEYEIKYRELKEQAKAMHKKEIMDAYDKGEFNDGINETAEQYYTKTYGK